MRSFGELLVLYTQQAGISDTELARAIGVQRQTIFRWKEGQVARPRYREDILRIAEKLRLKPDERDELLLAGGFPPVALFISDAVADGKASIKPATSAPAGDTDESAAQPARETTAAAPVKVQRPPRLVNNPGLLLGVSAAVMLAVALAGYFVLPLIFGPRAAATPAPVPVVLSAPSATPALIATPPAAIVAAAGEKLLLVAPFVGYTSENLRFNVAGRINEALQQELQESALHDVRVEVLPLPVTAQLQARSLLSTTHASSIIWGEYDSGRVRANVTMPGEDETNWINPVDSAAKLALVINDEVPHAARILALYSLGRLYRQEQDSPAALRIFQKALALQPKEPPTLASLHFYIGTLLPKVQGLNVDALTAAIEHFSLALEQEPGWDNLLYNRGTVYLGRALLSPDEKADLDAAIADLSNVIEQQPNRVDPLINRGIAFYQRRGVNDLPAAAADFTRAIALSPDDSRGYYHRGLVGIRQGKDANWTEDLMQALKLQPQDAAINNGLCWGYALDGDAQAALPYCEQAVATDRTGSSFDGRAITYSQLGRYADAAADLKQYLLWVQSDYPSLYTKYHGPEAEQWIATLQAGENPFTAAVRSELR